MPAYPSLQLPKEIFIGTPHHYDGVVSLQNDDDDDWFALDPVHLAQDTQDRKGDQDQTASDSQPDQALHKLSMVKVPAGPEPKTVPSLWHMLRHAHPALLSILATVVLAMLLPVLLSSLSLQMRQPASGPSANLAPSVDAAHCLAQQPTESQLHPMASADHNPATQPVETHKCLQPDTLPPAFAEVEVEVAQEHHESSSASPELRQARDHKWYTWDAFVEYYGPQKAQVMWEQAGTLADINSLAETFERPHSATPPTSARGQVPRTRLQLNGAPLQLPDFGPQEKRVARDGFAYTKEEFVEFYGGIAQWDAAPPAQGRKERGWPDEVSARVMGLKHMAAQALGWRDEVAARVMDLKPMAASALGALGAMAK